MNLLPREEQFFEMLTSQAEVIVNAADLLAAGVEAGNSQLKDAAAEILTLEYRGDEIIHDIFTKLNQTFITPIDPEDIHRLSSTLDDVLDGIEDASFRIVGYQVDPIPDAVKEMAKILQACAANLLQALQALSRHEKVLESCIEINRLENEADRVERSAVTALFQNERDPVRLIKLKEIYEFLEATTNSCEDVADLLQNVVLKNS
jgi:predicted phosphate transport protein (TIGR00153 family)